MIGSAIIAVGKSDYGNLLLAYAGVIRNFGVDSFGNSS